jgi:hypothetical protein
MMQVSGSSLPVANLSRQVIRGRLPVVYIVTTIITFIISTKIHLDLSYLVGAGALVGCGKFYGLHWLVTSDHWQSRSLDRWIVSYSYDVIRIYRIYCD